MTREEIEQIIEIAVQKGIGEQKEFCRSQQNDRKESLRNMPMAKTGNELKVLNLFRKLNDEKKTIAIAYLMGALAAQRVNEEMGLE